MESVKQKAANALVQELTQNYKYNKSFCDQIQSLLDQKVAITELREFMTWAKNEYGYPLIFLAIAEKCWSIFILFWEYAQDKDEFYTKIDEYAIKLDDPQYRLPNIAYNIIGSVEISDHILHYIRDNIKKLNQKFPDIYDSSITTTYKMDKNYPALRDRFAQDVLISKNSELFKYITKKNLSKVGDLLRTKSYVITPENSNLYSSFQYYLLSFIHRTNIGEDIQLFKQMIDMFYDPRLEYNLILALIIFNECELLSEIIKKYKIDINKKVRLPGGNIVTPFSMCLYHGTAKCIRTLIELGGRRTSETDDTYRIIREFDNHPNWPIIQQFPELSPEGNEN